MEKYFRVFVCLVFSMLFFKVSFAYPLPFMTDEAWRVDQTWWGTYSHSDERALDMNMGSEYVDEGLAVLTACSGTVAHADWTQSAYGRVVLVECSAGVYQRTAHLKDIYVQEGQTVREGQVIGAIGGSGWDKDNGYQEYKFLPHLHWNFMATNSPGTVTSIEYTVEYQGGSGGALAVGDSYTSTNNNMFSEVEDEYGSFIGPATNAVHFYDSTTQYPNYDANGDPDDVYIQNHDDSGDSDGTSAILYDAYGGARKAYLVRSGFWDKYQSCGGPNGNCGSSAIDECGAPLNDEYEQDGGNARQDFQGCYLYWNGSSRSTSANAYPVVSPGWTDNVWNSTYSYAFAEAYERNGARTWMGEATTSVGEWSGELVQEFSGGYWGDLAIMHNSEDNEAYLIRTGFWDKYQVLSPSAVGYACQDEVQTQTGAQQGFEKLTMYWNGSTVTTVTKSSGEYGCERTADGVGGSYTPTEGDLLVYGNTIYWVQGGSTHGIVSSDMFEACGFSWSEPYPVSEDTFNTLPQGMTVHDPVYCGAVQDGTLVNQNGTVYEYWGSDASWHGYPSTLVFDACLNDWSSIQEMSSSVFASITTGSVVGNSVDCGVLSPGDLVHWNGTVYRITETSLKRGFTSSEVFNACGYDWDLITYLALEDYPIVTTLQDGSAISGTSDCANITGDLVHWEWTGTIYYLTGTGYKRGVTSTQAMTSCGFDWNQVRYVTNANGAVVWTLGDAANITGNGDCP